ncbi:hypothetical protein RR46_15291 [Papilio xuthus]|uniref:Uncharacterized protein n=1 Tax=Papilio xuthus TaxID=66420 RepID=A0A194PET3_PAPXU|nr:hypothetical protein RR46_15291 [Papilio xuthus]
MSAARPHDAAPELALPLPLPLPLPRLQPDLSDATLFALHAGTLAGRVTQRRYRKSHDAASTCSPQTSICSLVFGLRRPATGGGAL